MAIFNSYVSSPEGILVFLIPSPCHQNTFGWQETLKSFCNQFPGLSMGGSWFEAAMVTVIGGIGNVLPCQKTGWILKDLDGYSGAITCGNVIGQNQNLRNIVVNGIWTVAIQHVSPMGIFWNKYVENLEDIRNSIFTLRLHDGHWELWHLRWNGCLIIATLQYTDFVWQTCQLTCIYL